MLRYNASQLAALLGFFGKAKAEDAFHMLCRQNDPSNRFREKTSLEQGLELLEKHNALSLVSEHPETPEQVSIEKEQMTLQLPEVSKKERLLMRQAGEHLINTRYGQQRERPVIELFSQKSGLEIEDCSKTLYCQTFDHNGEQFVIQGRIDGFIKASGQIVEVKNRVYKLFHVLKPYEKVQLQSYFELCNAESGFLVEAFKQEIDVQLEQRDSEWFRQCVLDPLAEINKRLRELTE